MAVIRTRSGKVRGVLLGLFCSLSWLPKWGLDESLDEHSEECVDIRHVDEEFSGLCWA